MMPRMSSCRRLLIVPALVASGLVVITAGPSCGNGITDQESGRFPVTPVKLIEGVFNRSEGIAFNAAGDLFVAANAAAWRVDTEGNVTKLTDLYSNLGMAAIGERDVLIADFGPTNAFDHGPNDDGIVWRITPEGERSVAASGQMGDPNAIVVRADGSFLVSDDATDEIWLVDTDGEVSLFTDAIDHPNGMVLSPDGRALYVAQIFTQLDPIVPDDRIWRLDLDKEGDPAGDPVVVARTGDGEAPDGLAMDSLGRLYIAANGAGKIYRVDLQSGERVVIAENMRAVASLAFGRGAFDPQTIFCTSTYAGGGTVWKVAVGVTGASLHH